MIKIWTLGAYLGRQYFLWLFAFLFALSGIIFLFEVAELMRRAADLPNTTFDIVLRMGFYKLPETVEKILPFVILFSGMFTFWRLTRSQELIVARASGISAWQFLTPALLVTLCFGILNTTLLNPVGSKFNSEYRALEQRYLSKTTSLELTGAGLWLRQKEKDRNYLLHADHVSTNPLILKPVIVFIYDNTHQYLGRIDAPKAVLKQNYWEIGSGFVNWENTEPQPIENFRINTNLTMEKIQESMAPPNTISFWELPEFIRALKAIGLPATRHQLEFNMLLSFPLLLCAMVFFAAAFSLRLNRRGGILNAMMGGVVFGSTIFATNNVVTAMGANQVLPVYIAAWAIPLIAFAGGHAALLYLEDG